MHVEIHVSSKFFLFQLFLKQWHANTILKWICAMCIMHMPAYFKLYHLNRYIQRIKIQIYLFITGASFSHCRFSSTNNLSFGSKLNLNFAWWENNERENNIMKESHSQLNYYMFHCTMHIHNMICWISIVDKYINHMLHFPVHFFPIHLMNFDFHKKSLDL